MGLLNTIRGSICKGTIGKIFNTLSFTKYMNYCVSYYKSVGVQIDQPVTYIHPSVYFDSHNYSFITVGKNVTISRNVTLLVHDYSIANALIAADYPIRGGVPHFEKKISIGDGSFIGAQSILLPGTIIGKNSIVGAGAVVKGEFPDNSIIVGNPAHVIANTVEWAEKKIELKDWGID